MYEGMEGGRDGKRATKIPLANGVDKGTPTAAQSVDRRQRTDNKIVNNKEENE